MIYVIRLQNCAFFAHHGLADEEEALGQRFFVDAELTVEADSALENDEMAETVDYGKAFALIEAIVTGERFKLIEALAFAIGKRLMDAFPRIVVAEITVRKPSAPIPGIFDNVSVTVVLP